MAVIQKVGFHLPVVTRRDSLSMFGRGVHRRDSSQVTGWAQRLASVAGYDNPNKIVDLTQAHPALDGGNYLALSSRDLSLHSSDFRQDTNDSVARDIAAMSIAEEFELPSSLAARTAGSHAADLDSWFSVRGVPLAPGYVASGGRGAVSFWQPGRVFQSIDTVLTATQAGTGLPRFSNDTEVIFAEIKGFGGPDQRNRENAMRATFDTELGKFVSRMKATSFGGPTLWSRLVVFLIPHTGRTHKRVGDADVEGDEATTGRRRYTGTGPGHATDYFVFGGGVDGGKFFGLLTNDELRTQPHTTPQFSPVQVLHRAITSLGRPASSVIDLDNLPQIQFMKS
jgi:hypothetical protein